MSASESLLPSAESPDSASSPKPPLFGAWQLWATVFAGLFATAAFVWTAWYFVLGQESEALGFESNKLADEVSQNVRSLGSATHGFQSLIHSADNLGTDQFRAFSDDVLKRPPYLTGMAYHPRVTHAQRGEFETKWEDEREIFISERGHSSSRTQRLAGRVELAESRSPDAAAFGVVDYRERSHENSADASQSTYTPTTVLIAKNPTPQGFGQMSSLAYTRSIPLDYKSAQITLTRPLDLSAMNWQLLAFAAVTGLGLTFLGFRVVRAAQLQQAINEGLENTVAQQTSDLRSMNIEVSEILDNLDDAVLMVGEDLLIHERFSPSTLNILGVEEASGSDLSAILFDQFEEGNKSVATHQAAFEAVFGGDKLQWEMSEPKFLTTIEYQLPKIKGNNNALRTFRVKYAPLYDETGRTVRVLVVLSDLTELLRLRRQAAERDELNREMVDTLTELLAVPPSELFIFLHDKSSRLATVRHWVDVALVDQPLTHSPKQNEAMRQIFTNLHTVKGNARALGFTKLSESAHLVELELAKLRQDESDDPNAYISRFADLMGHARRYDKIAADFLSTPSQSSTSTAPATGCILTPYIRHLGERTDEGEAHTNCLVRVSDSLRHNSAFSIRALFCSYQPMLSDISGELGKEVSELGIEGELQDAFVDIHLRETMREMFTHGIRNAIDHGIESPAVRQQMHKPPKGRIYLEIRESEGAIQLCLCDDGAGLDVLRLTSSAATQSASPDSAPNYGHDPYELAFTNGVSSKSEISDVSGHGVGLDSIRSSMENENVRCELRPGKAGGIELIATIPGKRVVAIATTQTLHDSPAIFATGVAA